MLPSTAGRGTAKKLPYVGPTVAKPASAPNIGGNYSHAAVARAVAPKPVMRAAVSVPKPPPVVVPNNKGNYSRPAPPPPVVPGPISGGGGQAPAHQQIAKKAAAGGGGPIAKKSVAPIAKKAVPAPPAPVAPGPIPVQPPDINSYLAGDTAYQGYQGTLAEQLAQFQAQQAQDQASGAGSFAQRLRDLQTAQAADEANTTEDFAARGLGHSGSYADALTQLQQQYAASQGNLQTEQTDWQSSFGTALNDFQTQQQLALQQAQQEAIARRAAQYGLV